MTLRSFVRATALAFFAVLLVIGTVKAIDLTTDMGGFSGGQITGLRDTFVDQLNTETIAGDKTLTGTTVISGTTTLSGATTASGTFDATSTFSLGGTAVTATAAELNAVADASSRVVTIVATDAITKAEHANRINLMAEVGGDASVTLTLPEATGTGDVYKFYVGVVNTSNYVIAALTTDTFSGVIVSTQDAADTVVGWEIDGTDDTITLDGDDRGGVAIGDWLEFVDCLDTTWCVSGQITSKSTEITPASGS